MASAPGPLLYLDLSYQVGTVDIVETCLIGLCLILSTWSLVTRRRISGVTVRPSHPVDVVLTELLEKSRAAGGRVHIHDVEESLRRNLG